MKKLILLAHLAIFSLTATVTFAVTESPNLPGSANAVSSNEESNLSEFEITELTVRIEQIRDMDKKNLSKSEKSELRKELKEMKKNLRKASGGIYIGAGTLLVALLVILLLV